MNSSPIYKGRDKRPLTRSETRRNVFNYLQWGASRSRTCICDIFDKSWFSFHYHWVWRCYSGSVSGSRRNGRSSFLLTSTRRTQSFRDNSHNWSQQKRERRMVVGIVRRATRFLPIHRYSFSWSYCMRREVQWRLWVFGIKGFTMPKPLCTKKQRVLIVMLWHLYSCFAWALLQYNY